MFSKIKKLFKFLQFVLIAALIVIAGFVIIDTLFPVKYIELIEKYAEEYDLDPAFVCAMINGESGFDKDAVSHRGATGLMQIMPQTAQWGAEELGIENYSYERITEPELNINLGCWYIGKLFRQYDFETDTALAAYNAGSGTVSGWLRDTSYSKDGKTLSSIPYKETSDYVQKINFYTKIYAFRLKYM